MCFSHLCADSGFWINTTLPVVCLSPCTKRRDLAELKKKWERKEYFNYLNKKFCRNFLFVQFLIVFKLSTVLKRNWEKLFEVAFERYNPNIYFLKLSVFFKLCMILREQRNYQFAWSFKNNLFIEKFNNSIRYQSKQDFYFRNDYVTTLIKLI